MDWYPGDEYVDWWAFDPFDVGQFTLPAITSFVEEAKKRRYPVMIAESSPWEHGVGEGEASWNAFYGPYFNFIRRHDNLKAFCLISTKWDETGDARWKHKPNCRITDDSYVLARFHKEMENPIYVHSSNLDRVRYILGMS
jgi:hypothetical protein